MPIEPTDLAWTASGLLDDADALAAADADAGALADAAALSDAAALAVGEAVAAVPLLLHAATAITTAVRPIADKKRRPTMVAITS